MVDEIVIVDTGSMDGTLEIAREFGAKIVHHPWNDDFSEARNVSLANATGDWALWLDADEEVEWATSLHRLNRSREGLEVCERADRLGIRQAGVDFARGYCLLHERRYAEAESAFRSAIAQGQEKESL